MDDLILRPYQLNLKNKTAQAIHGGYKAPLVVSSTGSGKTVIFSAIARNAADKKKRVLILTHRIEILQQTVDKLAAFDIPAGVIRSGSDIPDTHIIVAMIGSLIRKVHKLAVPDLIIIDECHHAVAKTWKKVIESFPDALRLGFTATPERASGEGLSDIFDTLIEGPSISWLVDQGYLSRPRMFCGPHVEEKEKLKITRGDFDKTEQVKKRTKPYIIGSVIDHYRQYLNGLPTVCFCISIDHCHTMVDAFNSAGYKAEVIKGGLSRDERQGMLDGLASGEINVLCSCDVISEGVDVPVIAGAILLRRTKSLGLYLQQVGRALRPYPGKKEAIILDHCGVVYDHGHVLSDRVWSLEAKKRSAREQEARIAVSVCPKCSGVWPGQPRLCPDCGHNLQEDRDRKEGRKPPREIEGILREVLPSEAEDRITALTAEADRLQRMPAGKRQKAMISKIYRKDPYVEATARALGYMPGWSKVMYNKLRRGA